MVSSGPRGDANPEDLRDAGTDVVVILAGRVISLRSGYIPVMNRGQRDIDTSKPIRQVVARRKEVVSIVGALNKAEEYVLPPSVSAVS